MKSWQDVALKKQINEIYHKIRRECLFFRYLYILKTMVLHKRQYQKKRGHIRKIARILRTDIEVGERILNKSSYQPASFQNLVLCRGLNIDQQKKRDGMVISEPDKGSEIVVMNKFDFVRWVSETSINDETKFHRDI